VVLDGRLEADGDNVMTRIRTLVVGILALSLATSAVGQAPATAPAPAPQATPGQLIEAARQQFEAGKLVEAQQLIQGALERDPASIEAQLLAGEIFFAANDYDTARNFFTAVTRVEPLNFRANLGYGKILNANRQYRQAAVRLEKAEQVATEPARIVEVKRALAEAYVGMGRATDAVTKAEEAVKADTQNLDARQTLVEIRLAAAARVPAQLEPALKDAEAYVQRVKELVQQKPWDKERLQRLNGAYDLLLSALRELHNSFYERNLRGDVTNTLLAGKQAEAAAVLNRTAEVVSEQALLQASLRSHDALMLTEKAVEYDPKNVKYLEHLAALYQETRNREKAAETCRRILELKPDHAAARQYLESVGESAGSPPAAP